MSYDDQNIFAKILRGEMPAHKIYEDEHSLAFMDVFPRTKGHCLVIPKAPSRNILDADEDSLGAVMASVKKIANAAKSAFGADGITIEQNNEFVGGQTVFHLHFHIMPRYHGTPLNMPGGNMAEGELLAAQAKQIAAQL